MANKINIGASLTLDGEQAYKQSLKEITSEQKLLTSEMKLASAQYDENANSLEALEKKNEILTKQIDNQTDKVKLYSKAVEDSIDNQSKAAENVEKYKNELIKAQSEMNDLKNSSNATDEALEKQAKTVAELEKKLSLSETAYTKSTDKITYYKTSLNNAETQLEKLNSELNQNDKYLNEAKNSADKTANSIDNMGKQINQSTKETSDFGSSIKNNITSAAIIGGVVALGYAIEGVATKTIELGTAAAKYADDMLTMSTQTGISTDKLQAYNYMAELTDTSMETIEKTMIKNIKSMTSAQQGTATYVDAYKELNVAYQDGNKNLLDSETVYWNLIDALGQIEDETKRDSISLTIFGKSAQDLNTLIAQGSKGVTEFTDEAVKMGAVLDNDTLQKLGATDDAIQRFTQSTEILKRKIGAELSDEMTEAMDKISQTITDSGDEITELAEGGVTLLADGFSWIIENSDILIAGLVGISGAVLTSKAVDGIIAGVEAYKTLSSALKTATASQTALNFAQAASPIGLIVTAIAGVTAALVTYSITSDSATTETEKFIKSTRDVNTSLSESITKREENISSMNLEAGYMKTLGTELSKLNEKEVLSNSEKTRMKEIVVKLNSELPNLNLAIDDQTGKLTENTTEIEKSIDANLEWYKIQAAKEELIKLYEEQADAELEIYKINEKIAEQEETNAGYDKFKNVAELNNQKEALIETQKEELAQAEILNGYIKDNTDIVGENTEATSENTEAVNESLEVYTMYGDAVVGASDEMKTSISELNEKFSEAQIVASESLTSQVGLFQEAAEQSSVSVSEMATNLQSQTDAFNQYKEDILLASDLVAKGLMDEGLLGYIESFGIQGAGSLHELVSAAETDKESFNSVMAEWTEMQDAKTGLSKSMAEIETNYIENMKNIGVIIEDGNEEIKQSTVDLSNGIGQENNNLYGKFISTYDRMMVDANSRMKDGSKELQTVTSAGMEGVISAMNTTLNVVDGKSLEAEKAGTAFVKGFTQALSDGTSQVSVAMQTMINDSISNADFSGFRSTLDRMLGDALD